MTEAFIKELKVIIDREVQKIKLEELLPDDYTVQRMMKEHGIKKSQARRLLNNLTEQGYFTKVQTPNPSGGGAVIAYRPVERKKE